MIYRVEQIAVVDKMPTKRETYCLAKAIYYEARDQNVSGKIGIVSVILNRLDTWGKYTSICQTVFDGCNFSWVCNGAPQHPFDVTNIKETKEWRMDLVLARSLLIKYNYGEYKDNTGGASYFHEASMATPSWADGKKIRKTVQLDDHVFYRKVKY